MSSFARACALLILLGGCDSETSSGGAPASATVNTTPQVELLAAPPGPIAPLLQSELERAKRDGRDLIVYVGATWCEPCKYFHDAAQRGELDKDFPTLRILEFDLDRDRNRLLAAGCSSSMLPMFARPEPTGRCSGKHRIAGAIKGPGAVDHIAPRLRKLVDQ